MPDPVTGECPDLMAQVTKAGHVEGVAGKPDVIGGPPAPGSAPWTNSRDRKPRLSLFP
jgi:hypothetical protein